MNKKIGTLTAVIFSVVAFVFAGCSKSEQAQTKDAVKDMASQVSDLATTAWDSMKNSTYDQRSNLNTTLSRAADDMEAKAKEWGSKISSLSGDAKSSAQSALNNFNSSLSELRSKLTGVNGATSETWAKVKDGVGEAWKKVQDAYVKLQSNVASTASK